MNSVEGENNNFSQQLSEYISTAVASLEEGRTGYHRMNIDNKHLLNTSDEVILNSKLALETITNDSSEIAEDFVKTQSPN
jgi:hypothetical protein